MKRVGGSAFGCVRGPQSHGGDISLGSQERARALPDGRHAGGGLGEQPLRDAGMDEDQETLRGKLHVVR